MKVATASVSNFRLGPAEPEPIISPYSFRRLTLDRDVLLSRRVQTDLFGVGKVPTIDVRVALILVDVHPSTV